MSSQTHSFENLVGQVIGQRFLVKDRLDNTGQADVFAAEHVLTHRSVALKVARCELDATDPVVAHFQRVARVATQVEHPSCVRIFDFGVDERGYAFLAMERAEGRDLATVVKRDGPLSPEEIVGIGLQVLEGLGAAHQRGILHSEMQPRYVMVDRASGQPEAKLLGFGLGEIFHEIEVGGGPRMAVREGAARFAAPERLGEGSRVDHRADLFAAGAVLFYGLTGELPWAEGDEDPRARANAQPRVASSVGPKDTIPPGLDRVLQRVLSPVPSARYADASEMAAALRRSLREDPDEVSTVEAVHETFGRYKLLQQLATGGMGELHLVSAEGLPGLPKIYALKLLRSDLAEERGYVDRFLDEARLAIKLAHPNLAAVYDVGKQDDRFYMAMEYVVGKDCRRLLDRTQEDGLKIPLAVAIYVAREVADALAYAHRVRFGAEGAGLVHRDVSPRNIVLSYEGQVKLIDFGLAKHATTAGRTETGLVIGKVAYMAPEQCLGDPVDRRVDIYAVGAVLYELLTGRRLRETEDFERLAEEVRRPVTTLPSALRPEVPVAVDEVLRKALAVNREERYAHAEGLRDDLTEILGTLEPRMSRDTLAELMRKVFSAERRADAERARLPETEPPPAEPSSALSGGLGGSVGHSDTRAMPAISPDSQGLGGAATIVSTGPSDLLVPTPPKGAASKGRPAASEAVGPARPDTASEAPAASGRGARATLVVLLSIMFLLAGFALARFVAPRFLDRRAPRRTNRAAIVSVPAHPSAAAKGPAARPAAPPRRPAGSRPVARRGTSSASLAVARDKARAAVFNQMGGLARTSLRARGVLPSDLVAIPKLELPYERVRRGVAGRDLAKTLDGLAALRAALSSRRARCKRLRRAKYAWCRRHLRDLRKAAPKGREARKAFLARHGYADLKARLRELRRRAGDDKLTCEEKSLGYAKLIPDLVRHLRSAKVAEARWHEGLEALEKAFPKAAGAGDGAGGATPAPGTAPGDAPAREAARRAPARRSPPAREAARRAPARRTAPR